MSYLDRDKTLRNLIKKGFSKSDKKNKDHIFLDFFHNDKYVTHTKISHSGDDIRDGLIKSMSIQCKLDKEQFMNLANCPLSKEEYLKILDSNKELE